MSTIPSSNIGDSLRSGLESLDSHGAIEQLRLRDGSLSTPDVAADGVETLGQSGSDAARGDPGEDTLNADAWGSVPTGDRLLAGDLGFEAQLGGMELSQAADQAADAIADALA